MYKKILFALVICMTIPFMVLSYQASAKTEVVPQVVTPPPDGGSCTFLKTEYDYKVVSITATGIKKTGTKFIEFLGVRIAVPATYYEYDYKLGVYSRSKFRCFGADGYYHTEYSSRNFLGYEHSYGPPDVFGVGDWINDITPAGKY